MNIKINPDTYKYISGNYPDGYTGGAPDLVRVLSVNNGLAIIESVYSVDLCSDSVIASYEVIQ